MLSEVEAKEIDDYLFTMYSTTKEDMALFDKVDELVLDYTFAIFLDEEEASKPVKELAEKLYSKMKEMFLDDCGVTPRLLQYQERFNQLQTIYAKLNNLDGMYLDNVSLLCFVSSFDLYYLQEIKNKRQKAKAE